MKRYLLLASYRSVVTGETIRFRYKFWTKRAAVQMAQVVGFHFYTISPDFTLRDRWGRKQREIA
jgi:hypothetical protein